MNPSSTDANAWVQRGFAHQNSGDAAAAEADYEQALALQVDHPAALQLLGLLARKAGDPARAEELMRRSLQADPRQPHVLNNLGNLLDSLKRREEALNCFDEALNIETRYADAHYNRARVLHGVGRIDEAATALRRAVALVTLPKAPWLQLQAQMEDESGRPDEALATLNRALRIGPARPALLHNRATLLQRRHRHTEALADHEMALALGLDAADAHYNRGNTLQSLGRSADAVAAYRRALILEPGHALALYDLARLRWRLGEPDFDTELRHASATEPANAAAPAVHAQLLWRAERHADAAATYATALQRAPQTASLHDGLARCLARLGSLDEAVVAHQKALSLAPQDAALRCGYATTLLMARQHKAAEEHARLACELAPDDAQAAALLGLAWRVTDPAREEWLNDAARLVQVVDLPSPAGFNDMEAFNRALAAELLALHRDRMSPVDQTLRHGTQTLGNLFDQGLVHVKLLRERFNEAIGRYISRLPNDTNHPFLRRRGAAWRCSDAWSSCLQPGGFHTNHVHPHGWISATYYVHVPPDAQDAPATSSHEGWLQFGEPDFDCGLKDAVRLRVQPRAGRLVLFPSMFWHGTVPFSVPATRLTIAFDVMPA